ncbi:MAG TPA: hypothetical protein VK154_15015 [Chitinophagales bacterium]|nr:hypothetical protein [Chitinophagales bacterium]
MKHLVKADSKKQINNLVAKIKARYPHLYEETGGKYIRQTLRRMLDSEETLPGVTTIYPVFSSNSHAAKKRA